MNPIKVLLILSTLFFSSNSWSWGWSSETEMDIAEEIYKSCTGSGLSLKKFKKKLDKKVKWKRAMDVISKEVGMTPLHACAKRGQPKYMEILIKSGGNINDINSEGDSLLIMAVKSVLTGEQKIKMLNILIKSGANLNLKNKLGKTALKIAQFVGNNEVILILGGKKISPKQAKALRFGEFLNSFLVQNFKSNSKITKNFRNGLMEYIDVINAPLDEIKNTALIKAIRKNNFTMTYHLIDNGSNVNSRNIAGTTPLITAIILKNLEMIKLLIKHDATLESKDKNGKTAMDYAIVQKLGPKIVRLVETYSGKIKRETVVWMKKYSKMGQFSRLVKSKWSSIKKLSKKRQLIFEIAKKGDLKTFKYLLQKGNYGINIVDKTKKNFLHYSSIGGNIDIFNFLLTNTQFNKKSNLNLSDLEGHTPLHLAAINAQKEVVKLLLKNKLVEVKAVDKNGKTPFLWAIGKKYTEIINVFLKSGKVNLSDKDKFGKTALYKVVENADLKTLSLLLNDYKANPNIQSNIGFTPLQVAVSKNNSEMVNFLLENKRTDPNITDNKGRTALYGTIIKQNLKNARLILFHNKTDPNIQALNGNTALHTAVYKGNTDFVRLLINNSKIDPNINNKKGFSPYHLTIYKGMKKSSKILHQNNKVDLNFKTSGGDTPLHLALKNKRYNYAGFLIRNQRVDPDISNKLGRPILMASKRGLRKLVSLFIKRNVNLNARTRIGDLKGYTPLMLSINYYHSNVAMDLINAGARSDIHPQWLPPIKLARAKCRLNPLWCKVQGRTIINTLGF